MRHLRASWLAGAFVLLTLGATVASAQSPCAFESSLTVPDAQVLQPPPSNSPFPPGTAFGEVCIDLLSTGLAEVIFLTDSNQVLFEDHDAYDLNLNGNATFIPSGFSQRPGFNDPEPFSQSSGDNVGGFGVFNFNLSQQDDFGSAVLSTTFRLSQTSGTPWTSAQQVLTANGNGFDAAAHIAVCDVPGCPAGSTATHTGYVAEPATSTVPEPASVLLLGTMIAGTGAALRKRMRSRRS